MYFRHCLFIIIVFFIFPGCYKQADAPKHVFFIVMDTLCADHLGCYGYPVPTSPIIDRLAREGVLYKNAYATASNTLESTISFFNSTTALTNKIHKLSPAEAKLLRNISLQACLKHAGYNTLAVVANPWLKYHQDYFQDGFTHFQFVISDSWEQEGIFNTTELVTQTVLDVLDTKFDNNGRNFFYIHYLDPHDPYRSPVDYGFFPGETPQNLLLIHDLSGEEELRVRAQKDPNYSGLPTPKQISPNVLNYKISQYDGEIRYVDSHIGELLDKLKSMKILDDSLIIITSDHGEEFLEHGLFKHGFQLYDETIHIPLIFYWKDHLDAQSKEAIVSGIDIAPTILDFCQIKPPSYMLGSNVFEKEGEEPILFCTHFVNQNQRGMRMGKWKLIENVSTGEIKVFDSKNDHGEQNNLFNSAPKKCGSPKQWEHLLQSYKNLLSKHSVKLEEKPEKKLELDAEIREQLKALGYL